MTGAALSAAIPVSVSVPKDTAGNVIDHSFQGSQADYSNLAPVASVQESQARHVSGLGGARGKEVLIPLCRRGDRAGIERQLAQGARVDEADVEGNTPLHVAVEAPKNEIATVQCLLEHNANVNATNYLGATPLHYVCLRRGSYRGVANLLLEHGAHLDYQTVAGKTPLHIACENHVAELVDLLCVFGAATNTQDVQQNTTVHCTLLKDGRDTVKREVLETLLANEVSTGQIGGAADNSTWGTWDRAQGGFGSPNAEGLTPLHLAARSGALRCAQFLLDRKAKPQAVNASGQTALHLACAGSYAELVALLVAVSPEILDMVDHDGNAALHLCAAHGSLECALVLLRKDCSTALRNGKGLTAFDVAKTKGTDLSSNHNPELLQALQDSKKAAGCRQS